MYYLNLGARLVAVLYSVNQARVYKLGARSDFSGFWNPTDSQAIKRHRHISASYSDDRI